MTDIKIDNLDLNEDPQVTCKGKIYRCEENVYVGKDGSFVQQWKMRPMKRLSCPGCEFCDGLDFDLKENVSCGCPPAIIDPQDGKQ